MEEISGKGKRFIVSKIRDAWRYYSEARRDCLTSKVCVSCQRRKPKIYADHITPVGSFVPEENPYITRMFCNRANLQPLCEGCHYVKTKAERAARRKKQ